MRRYAASFGVVTFLWAAVAIGAAEEPVPSVRSIQIRGRVFYLNDKPFFPLMVWLQDQKNFAAARACGINTVAGYSNGSSGTKNVREYLDLVQKAGFYGVMPFDERLKGHPALFGYIHGDEPDLPHQESDAQIEPAGTLRINRGAPLWKLLDGDVSSWSVLDPLQGVSLTVKLKEPITVRSIAIHLTVSEGLALPREISFAADGNEILKAALQPKRGRQSFELSKPATFKELRLKVLSIVPGKQEWGSISEIEAFDETGKNLLLSPPHWVTRSTPQRTLEEYRQIRESDPSRPVFMTLTSGFHPQFAKWPEEKRLPMYADFIKSADVIGYDIYPIYGWNKPEWIHLVHDCTQMLAEMAGPDRPVYGWIETSKGGQWTGDLAQQKDVTPAHIRAEVWMSICRGATAIGYFTHVWKPSYAQFGVLEENRAALRSINEQITRLTPAILGSPSKREIRVETEGNVKLDVMVRESGGETYLFAVNYDERMKQTKATIQVSELSAGATVTVVDEDRTIEASLGGFKDTWAPLAVHIYRVR
jgi:hypothetical protein